MAVFSWKSLLIGVPQKPRTRRTVSVSWCIRLILVELAKQGRGKLRKKETVCEKQKVYGHDGGPALWIRVGFRLCNEAKKAVPSCVVTRELSQSKGPK